MYVFNTCSRRRIVDVNQARPGVRTQTHPWTESTARPVGAQLRSALLKKVPLRDPPLIGVFSTLYRLETMLGAGGNAAHAAPSQVIARFVDPIV